MTSTIFHENQYKKLQNLSSKDLQSQRWAIYERKDSQQQQKLQLFLKSRILVKTSLELELPVVFFAISHLHQL